VFVSINPKAGTWGKSFSLCFDGYTRGWSLLGFYLFV
jgi:hypothetical protein